MIPNLSEFSAALARGALRQRVLANDLANAETPGFVPLDVAPGSPRFGDVLADALALERTDRRHITGAAEPAPARPELTSSQTLVSPNGNGVDPEATMAAIAENALWYRAVAAAATGEIALVRAALQ
jgi:flagellar basal-body rod protein FlgB